MGIMARRRQQEALKAAQARPIEAPKSVEADYKDRLPPKPKKAVKAKG